MLPTLLANYSLVTERELLAAIDFVVCAGADIFVGNSVSTFSAFLEIQRQRQHRIGGSGDGGSDGARSGGDSDAKRQYVQFHYNGGGIPLLKFLPIDSSANGKGRDAATTGVTGTNAVGEQVPDLESNYFDLATGVHKRPLKWVFTLHFGEGGPRGESQEGNPVGRGGKVGKKRIDVGNEEKSDGLSATLELNYLDMAKVAIFEVYHIA